MDIQIIFHHIGHGQRTKTLTITRQAHLPGLVGTRYAHENNA